MSIVVKNLILVFFLVLVWCFNWQLSTASVVPATHTVGVRTHKIRLSDSEVAVEAWYPSRSNARPSILKYGLFELKAAHEAPWGEEERYPLVILSHGNNGHRGSMLWLAGYLAARGYIVLAPDHPGNHFGNETALGSYEVWKRPQLMRELLDWALTTSPFRAHIDEKRIAVAGFSLGGYTSLALAGAQVDLAKFAEHCRKEFSGADCKFVLEESNRHAADEAIAAESYRDPRIRVAVALAPAWGPGAVESSLEKIDIPVLVLAAKDDPILNFQMNAKEYADHIEGSQSEWLTEGGHWVFLSRCSDSLKQYATELCSEPMDELRKSIHPKLQKTIEGFLREAL